MMTNPGTDIFSREVPELLQTHFDHLVRSAISVEVIRERGYQTALGRKALKDTGFSPAQRRAPGILIPLHAPDGSAAGFQYRPDRPREREGGKTVKYENPAGASVRLDVPPRCRSTLANPAVELWFTEGIKKVDALATAGACAVGLTGVWGWKGRNKFGGTTILADFDLLALKGRHCYLVFDSDLSTNPHVRQALERLAEHLSRKGAIVHQVFLPAGPAGEKVGVDDYLAQGHILEEMKALESPGETPPASPKVMRVATQYLIVDGVLCWHKPTLEGCSEVPLCNFNARVVEDITKDNGLETTRFFKIAGQLPGGELLPPVEIPSSSFNGLNWVTSEGGMKAVIAAGQAAKDRLREAIQLQSREARQRKIYVHTGWREMDGELYFLTGSGAMGRSDIEVELEPSLQRYRLPAPEGDPLEAIKKSFDFYLVAIPEVTMPLWAAIYAAPLTELINEGTSFTLWLVGASGAFKSTLSALALCHFGSFDAHHLPAAWRDTTNTLERLLFTLKDAPLVVDDWAPGQDAAKARDLEAKAEYIIRAQGNRQGRQRMRADTSIRPGYPPRGLLITSGEQLPSGHSQTARIFSVEIEKKDVDLTFLSAIQEDGHLFPLSMAHYITWLKSNWPHLKNTLPQRWRELRDSAQSGDNHPRLPEVISGLHCAVELATEYALEHRAISSSEAESYRKTGWQVLQQLSALQAGRIENERPATRAIEFWRTMIDTGKAILCNKDDVQPKTPAPGQTIIGWLDNSNGGSTILLDPKAAHGALVEYGARSGEPFTIKQDALWKDMARQNLIERTDAHNTVVARVYGNPKRVIKLKNSGALYSGGGNSGNSVNY